MKNYHEVIEAAWVKGYTVRITFDDLRRAELDMAKYLGRGIFKELKSIVKFKQLRVDAELGTIVWPNGADIAPEALYQDYLLTEGPNHRGFVPSEQGRSLAAVKEPAKRYGKRK